MKLTIYWIPYILISKLQTLFNSIKAKQIQSLIFIFSLKNTFKTALQSSQAVFCCLCCSVLSVFCCQRLRYLTHSFALKITLPLKMDSIAYCLRTKIDLSSSYKKSTCSTTWNINFFVNSWALPLLRSSVLTTIFCKRFTFITYFWSDLLYTMLNYLIMNVLSK